MSETDLLDRIDEVTADVCHQCGRALGASVSPWFCGQDCQAAWTAHHAAVERLTGYDEPDGGWADDRFRGGSGARQPRVPPRLPEGAFSYSFPHWPEYGLGTHHESTVLGSGEVTLLAPNGDPSDGEVIPVPSARVSMSAFSEDDRSVRGFDRCTTYAPRPLTYALHIDSAHGVTDAIRQHATPDWSSNDLTLHPFALTLTVDSNGKRYHFTFPRLDYYGEPGDPDPWWQARANSQWTNRPMGMSDDATYWFVLERDPAPVPVSVSG